MARFAHIFGVVVASPSDVPEERAVVRAAIREWNELNSLTSGVLLEPVMWETHVHPDMADRPQGVINEQVLAAADAVIGIFWSRVGTPSGTHLSGSVEEVEHFIAAGKPTMVYFSRCSVPIDVDVGQLAAVRTYEGECSARGIIGTYSSVDEFGQLVRAHIAQLAAHLHAEAAVSPDSSYSKKKRRAASLYRFEADESRLRIQADILLKLDSLAIQKALDHLGSRGPKSPVRVLDVGCADGYVANTRFGELANTSVLGIDVNEAAIEAACKAGHSGNIVFRLQDVRTMDPDEHRFDVVFCALALHHLENPEGVMHRLWAMLDDPGVLLVRGSDDGLKVNYPGNDDLEYLLTCTNTVRGSSDRHNGRKIYTQMKRLLPEPTKVEMEFLAYSTVGMDREERLTFFDSVYSFRANYAISLAQQDGASEADIALAERLSRIVRGQRERFAEDESLFSVAIQNIGIAYKG